MAKPFHLLLYNPTVEWDNKLQHKLKTKERS